MFPLRKLSNKYLYSYCLFKYLLLPVVEKKWAVKLLVLCVKVTKVRAVWEKVTLVLFTCVLCVCLHVCSGGGGDWCGDTCHRGNCERPTRHPPLTRGWAGCWSRACRHRGCWSSFLLAESWWVFIWRLGFRGTSIPPYSQWSYFRSPKNRKMINFIFQLWLD